jgi:hypothetical protein
LHTLYIFFAPGRDAWSSKYVIVSADVSSTRTNVA